ncbi:hypothetical protein ACLOJK_021983 [Asimina triloba]
MDVGRGTMMLLLPRSGSEQVDGGDGGCCGRLDRGRRRADGCVPCDGALVTMDARSRIDLGKGGGLVSSWKREEDGCSADAWSMEGLPWSQMKEGQSCSCWPDLGGIALLMGLGDDSELGVWRRVLPIVICSVGAWMLAAGLDPLHAVPLKMGSGCDRPIGAGADASTQTGSMLARVEGVAGVGEDMQMSWIGEDDGAPYWCSVLRRITALPPPTLATGLGFAIQTFAYSTYMKLHGDGAYY